MQNTIPTEDVILALRSIRKGVLNVLAHTQVISEEFTKEAFDKDVSALYGIISEFEGKLQCVESIRAASSAKQLIIVTEKFVALKICKQNLTEDKIAGERNLDEFNDLCVNLLDAAKSNKLTPIDNNIKKNNNTKTTTQNENRNRPVSMAAQPPRPKNPAPKSNARPMSMAIGSSSSEVPARPSRPAPKNNNVNTNVTPTSNKQAHSNAQDQPKMQAQPVQRKLNESFRPTMLQTFSNISKWQNSDAKPKSTRSAGFFLSRQRKADELPATIQEEESTQQKILSPNDSLSFDPDKYEEARQYIETRDIEAFKNIISNMNINMQDPEDQLNTLLHWAVAYIAEEMVLELLNNGAKQLPNEVNIMPLDLINAAISSGVPEKAHTDILSLLKSHN